MAPPAAHLPWTEGSIRRALATLLAGRDTWPTYAEFIAAGAKGLRDAVGRNGGAEWWASQMGVSGGDRRQGGVRRWNANTIRGALAEFLGRRTTWPTRREFIHAGHAGLYEAIRLNGGSRRWAAKMGVAAPADFAGRPVGSRQHSAPPAPRASRWTEDRIAAELSAFLAGRREWPRYSDFVSATRKGLYLAVRATGGPELWATRMRVRFVRRRGGLATYWTEERVREQLAEMLAGRDHWPAPAEFEAAGQQRLLATVYRLGGVQRWMAEFGLPAAPSRRPAGQSPSACQSRGPRRVWTDAAIAAAVTPLVEALGRWPTKSEFRAAGLGPALSAVYEYGGRALWQRRLGVSARPSNVRVPDRTRWTDQAIEDELRRFCQGRSDWPSLREFTDRGALPLYRAAGKRGGIAMWRQRLALD